MSPDLLDAFFPCPLFLSLFSAPAMASMKRSRDTDPRRNPAGPFPQSSSRINLSSLLAFPPHHAPANVVLFSVALLGVAAGASSSSPQPGRGGRRCWRSHPSSLQALSELLPPSPASQSSPGQWPRVWNPQHPTAHATHRLRTLGHCSLDPCGACFHRQVTSHSLEPETSRNSRVVMPSPN